MDSKRKAAGAKLLAAAQDFWQACHDEGQYGAVQWLEDSDGKLLIYTRAEYRENLMQNIHKIDTRKVHFFQGEVLPP